MTLWTPEWRVKANGTTITNVTLSNLTITGGRTDFNAATLPGYCQLSVINTDSTIYSWTVNTAITVEVKDSTGTYFAIFGGRISDFATEVQSSGSTAVVTRHNITALGALYKLQRALFDGNLAEDLDGAQMLDLLDELLTESWNEVSPALDWASYDATTTWANAGNVGLGEIDPGEYTMNSRQITDSYINEIANQIAASAGGYLYEDSQGRISYADASHRQDYLVANGYTQLDGAQAIGPGISSVIRQGNLVNKLVVDYGNNFNSSYTAEDTAS